jgi:F-type H+-transporting ATPase subunit delta
MKNKRRIQRDTKRLFRLCLTKGLLDENRVRSVVETLLKNNRSEGLFLLAQFLRRVKFDTDLHAAIVESATHLTEEFQDKVRVRLNKTYGQGLSIGFHESPNLLGGMRIKIGWDVYDGSVKGRLADLEAKF